MELTGHDLVLRPISESDLDFYFELRNRPEITGLPGRSPMLRSEVERHVRRWAQHWKDHDFGTWTIFDAETLEHRGRVEFDPMGPGWEGVSEGSIEVGCIIHPVHWNQGIATKATQLAVADCFSRVGLQRLVALAATDNKPSLRALEKGGWQLRGQTWHEDDLVRYELFELDPDV